MTGASWPGADLRLLHPVRPNLGAAVIPGGRNLGFGPPEFVLAIDVGASGAGLFHVGVKPWPGGAVGIGALGGDC